MVFHMSLTELLIIPTAIVVFVGVLFSGYMMMPGMTQIEALGLVAVASIAAPLSEVIFALGVELVFGY